MSEESSWGVLVLNQRNYSTERRVRLVYSILECAAANRTSLQFEGNCREYIWRQFELVYGIGASSSERHRYLLFQLGSNPLTPNSDALFFNQRVLIQSGIDQENPGYTLKSKMLGIQKVFEFALSHQEIEHIEWNLYFFNNQEIETLKTNAGKLSSIMLKSYRGKRKGQPWYWPPEAKVIITR